MDNEKVSFYSSKLIMDRLRAIALLQGRTISELIREAITKIIKEYE